MLISQELKSKLESSGWLEHLSGFFASSEYKDIISAYNRDISEGSTIYPPKDQIFRCLFDLKFNNIKVVIVDQEPYHGEGQANGLAFAVNKGQSKPLSLRNLFRELHDDTGINPNPSDGTLSGWLDQGVMLLNSSLTVRRGEPGSHKDFKWDQLTDLIIKKISDNKDFVVFILIGQSTQTKAKLIDRRKHGIIETAHPAPLSAYKFFGSKPFTSANNLLQLNKLSPIDWINTDGKKDGLFAKFIRNMR